MPTSRKYVLSIAGHDPSAGAGVSSDIKTFEANGVYGLGVCTALTIQNDRSFESVQWVELNFIYAQLEILLNRFEIEWVKIGLIENLDHLNQIISFLHDKNPSIKIIWDPILSASAGYDFHKNLDPELLIQVLNQLYLITPNKEEALLLSGERKLGPAADFLKKHCTTYISSAFNIHKRIGDTLYKKAESEGMDFLSLRLKDFSKHGSGCVLSSAITAQLAKGVELEQACVSAKDYALEFLQSNDQLLGYHQSFRN